MRKAASVILRGVWFAMFYLAMSVGFIIFLPLAIFMWCEEKLNNFLARFGRKYHLHPGLHKVSWSESVVETAQSGISYESFDLPYRVLERENPCSFPGCPEKQFLGTRKEYLYNEGRMPCAVY